MDKEFIFNSIPTIKFPYTVTYIIPSEVYDTTIFKDNLKKIPRLLKKWIEIIDKLNDAYRRYDNLIFDKERNVIINEIIVLKNELELNMREINSGISPYCWRIMDGCNTFYNGVKINADYLMQLFKKNS